ncbi:MAG: hypothetical protein U9N59_01325 [Campylobacterota bacterium]|nr:hypothetical protein [Campylobacterota bacterium]
MKLFVKLLFLSIIFIGCNSDEKTVEEEINTRICPQCNMPLPDSNLHTSKACEDGDKTYFDDVGCMILWAKDEKVDLSTIKTRIFSNDTKKYIDPFKGYFQINERTPMLYGFSAYEKECDGCIKFDEVVVKMLRGEHMANPKIRKQILGY